MASVDHMNSAAEPCNNDQQTNDVNIPEELPNLHKENNRSCIRWRFITIMLVFFANFIYSTLSSNVNIAVVAMVNSSSKGMSQTECGNFTDTTTSKIGEFSWDSETRGLVLSSYSWGFIVPLLFVGLLVDIYGPKLIMAGGASVAIAATILGPVAARTNFGFFIVTRVACGMGLSVVRPCAHGIVATWFNTGERSKAVTVALSGVSFGSAFTSAVSGYLCDLESDGGWPWAFYVFGIMSVVWLVLWCIFARNIPRENPWISNREVQFIEENKKKVKTEKKAPPLPWRSMLTSAGVWGLAVNQLATGWGNQTLATNLPSYMSEVLGFDIKSNGIYSSLPDILTPFYIIAMGSLADYLIANNIIKVTNVRRLYGVSAFYLCVLFLLIITFLVCQTMSIYACLVLAKVFMAGNFVAGSVNGIDMAPNFAGALEGISSLFYTIPGIVSPYVTGVLTEGKETKKSWDVLFYISIGIIFATGSMYGILCRAEVQSWNFPSNEKKIEVEVADVRNIDTADAARLKIDSMERSLQAS